MMYKKKAFWRKTDMLPSALNCCICHSTEVALWRCGLLLNTPMTQKMKSSDLGLLSPCTVGERKSMQKKFMTCLLDRSVH